MVKSELTNMSSPDGHRHSIDPIAESGRDPQVSETVSAIVRLTRAQDAQLLPTIERSAGGLFREVPGLESIADGDDTSAERHLVFVRAGTSWVAVDAFDRPFGFLCAEPYGSELHIWELAVHRDHQRRGAGRALLETACAHARESGLVAVTLTTFRSVLWNEPLYSRFGFETLQPEDLGDRLAGVVAEEHARGLPQERRCAMRLMLG
jgi:ribosomal protein S18 acetylase RimI-like enzyme